jgi:hypothetical protein
MVQPSCAFGCGTHSTAPATSRVGNRQPHLPNVERNRPRICRPEQPGSRIPRPPPTPSPRHQIYTLPCLNKFQSSCHSNRSHKFRRVLRNDRRCCNNTYKTATTAKQPTLSNTRNSPGAHGSKGSWCERSSNASDLWPRMVATMGIVSNHAQSQVAGISRTCLT